MNFFKKKSKIFISMDSSDLKMKKEDLSKLFLELNEEISKEEILVIKFSELLDLPLSVAAIIISFIILVEKSHSINISIQAEIELQDKLKEANFAVITTKFPPA